MTGKHRLRRDRQTWTMHSSATYRPFNPRAHPTCRPYNPAEHPTRRLWATIGLTVGALSAVIIVAASGVTVPDAQAQGFDGAQIEPVPAAPLQTNPVPRNTDEQRDLDSQVNERFLAAIAAAGIPIAGREDELLLIAKRGAASHTTDDDLEQTIRALFAIDEKQAEKFVHQVRLNWPGPHDVDTDQSGR